MRASLRWLAPAGRWTWPAALGALLLGWRVAGYTPWGTFDGWLVVWMVMVAITVHDGASSPTPEGQFPSWGKVGAETVKLLGMAAMAVWVVHAMLVEVFG